MRQRPRKSVYLKIVPPVLLAAAFLPNVAVSELGGDLAEEIRVIEIDDSITGTVPGSKQTINYCSNMLDDARETRNAVLTERLAALEGDVGKKLDLVSERIATLKMWMERRDAFLARTNQSLVEIFQTMRPDAAASQLTEIGPALSASIIVKLEPKTSSAILAEMKPTDAAKITMTLTSLIANNDKQ